MRFCRLFLIVLLCSVFCIGLFSVSSFAATIEQYSYNGVVLPKLPDGLGSFVLIFQADDGNYFMSSLGESYADSSYGTWQYNYKLDSDQWVSCSPAASSGTIVWANYTVKNNYGTAIEGSDPVVTLIEVPEPPRTMDDILGDIVDIFNSCISWVGSVGSTILDKPILLFYAALPLCGIGVGFFKRLKS